MGKGTKMVARPRRGIGDDGEIVLRERSKSAEYERQRTGGARNK
jgi:hypothetical protein